MTCEGRSIYLSARTDCKTFSGDVYGHRRRSFLAVTRKPARSTRWVASLKEAGGVVVLLERHLPQLGTIPGRSAPGEHELHFGRERVRGLFLPKFDDPLRPP